MKTLFEIIEDVKLNNPVDEQDLRYALLAESYLCNMKSALLLDIYQKDKPRMYDKRIEINLEAGSKALNKPPKEWLGWNNDPANPEYQKFHQLGMKLVDKALKGELPNQKKAEAELRKE